MIRALPKGFFSNKFQFLQGGQEVGSITIAKWGAKAEIYIPELTVHAYRKGVFKPRFILEQEGKVIASAIRKSMWRNHLELQLGQKTCEVRRESLFSMTFVLLSGAEQIGCVAREGWFTHRSTIELPRSWPLPLQIFVFWVVLALWKRMEASVG